MKLPNSIEANNEEMFGTLKFSALRRERMVTNDDGTASDEIKERVYNLKCKEQGCMLSVGIPPEVPLKEYDCDSEVVLVNPVFGTVATATFNGNADIDWWVKADDIVLKSKVPGNRQPHPEPAKIGPDNSK